MIDGDRIAEVTAGDVATDGATVIDATDKIVMPGLVDFHYHTALGKGYRTTCRSGSTCRPAGTR